MTRLTILNRYFVPDELATSRKASSPAFALADLGWNVHAATSRQLYRSPDAESAGRRAKEFDLTANGRRFVAALAAIGEGRHQRCVSRLRATDR
jgi:hypothetical protein